MKTLLLWDIDGTLTLSSGAGMRALRTALHREFGIDRALDDIDYAGRTDRHIIRQIFTVMAHPSHPGTEVNLARLIEAYLAELPAALMNPSSRVLPGVLAALTALAARADFTQALLTGNVERGARIKLGHHGLEHFFAFGAFADDSPSRNELGPIALRRARERLGLEFAPHDVIVIGDTPHDIACGKVIGARTVAVATGQFSVEALATHAPDHVFADLHDTPAFLSAVGAA